MKVIIAGTRECTDYQFVKDVIIESEFEITEVVSGCAKGVDTLGEKWARENDIPIAHFPARWKEQGKAAGAIRNAMMANYGEALIAVIGNGPGTKDMVKKSEKKGLKIFKKYYPF